MRKSSRGFYIETSGAQSAAVIEDLGLTGAKGVAAPGMKEKRPKEETQMSEEWQRKFRMIVGKLLWISLDRPDLQHAVKTVCRRTGRATDHDWMALKKIGRYLVTAPVAVMVYEVSLKDGVLRIVLPKRDMSDDEKKNEKYLGPACSTTSGKTRRRCLRRRPGARIPQANL